MYKDRNTTYLHLTVTVRKQRNTIKGLHSASGAWVSNEDRLLGLATSYFRDLFTSSDEGDSDCVLDCVERRITDDMNHRLLYPFSI